MDEELGAAARALPWLPIDSAPKDGTRILVYEARPDGDEYSSYEVVFWDAFDWYAPLHIYTVHPTHWMPLSPPMELDAASCVDGARAAADPAPTTAGKE